MLIGLALCYVNHLWNESVPKHRWNVKKQLGPLSIIVAVLSFTVMIAFTFVVLCAVKTGEITLLLENGQTPFGLFETSKEAVEEMQRHLSFDLK